jgi:hypothetical protein
VIGRAAALQEATLGAIPALHPHSSPSRFHPENCASAILGPHRGERPLAARDHPQATVGGPQQGERLYAVAGTCHIQNVFGLP